MLPPQGRGSQYFSRLKDYYCSKWHGCFKIRTVRGLQYCKRTARTSCLLPDGTSKHSLAMVMQRFHVAIVLGLVRWWRDKGMMITNEDMTTTSWGNTVKTQFQLSPAPARSLFWRFIISWRSDISYSDNPTHPDDSTIPFRENDDIAESDIIHDIVLSPPVNLTLFWWSIRNNAVILTLYRGRDVLYEGELDDGNL